MKKAKYVKSICCPMTEEMFTRIIEITNREEISISEFLRDSVELKLKYTEEKEDEKEKKP